MKNVFKILLDARWVYVLPALHLAGCILTSITNFEWLPVALSEFPLGLLLVGFAWRFGHPLFWFGVFGTIWWIWLGRKFFRYLSEAD